MEELAIIRPSCLTLPGCPRARLEQGAQKGQMGGDWRCPCCGGLVFGSKAECFKCSVPHGVCFTFWKSGACADANCRYRHVRMPPNAQRARDAPQEGENCSKRARASGVASCSIATQASDPNIQHGAGGLGNDDGSGCAGNNASHVPLRRPPPAGVCWIFWKTGRCERGVHCNFPHQRPEGSNAPVHSSTGYGTRAQEGSAALISGQRKTKRQCTHQQPRMSFSDLNFTDKDPASSSDAQELNAPSTAAGISSEGLAFEHNVANLLALTAYHMSDVPLPAGHEDWIRQLLLDVELVTGMAPTRVLTITRALLRHLISTARAELGTACSAECGAKCTRREGQKPAQVFPLLHRVKVTSLAEMLERATFVRCDLAAMLQQPAPTPPLPPPRAGGGGAGIRRDSHAPNRRQDETSLCKKDGGSAAAHSGASDAAQFASWDEGQGGCRAAREGEAEGVTGKPKPKGKDWRCPCCGGLVFGSKAECFKCSVPHGVCFTFWKSGACADANCRYRHVPPGAQRARDASAKDECHSADDGEAAASRCSARRVDIGFTAEVVLGRLCSEAAGAAERVAQPAADAGCSSCVSAVATSGDQALQDAARSRAQEGGVSRMDGAQQVGVAYVADATARAPVLMAHHLEPLGLTDGLMLISGFNLVYLAGKDDAGRPATQAHGDATPGGPAGCGPRSQAPAPCGRQHLEMWEAAVIAALKEGCFQPPTNVSKAEVELEAGALDAAEVSQPRCRGTRAGRLCDVKGVVLSMSHIISHKTEKGPLYYFFLELGHLPDLIKPAQAPFVPEQIQAAGAGPVDTQEHVRSQMVVFQGHALMKWFPLVRPGSCVLITSLSRAQLDVLDHKTPCWRASAPPRTEAPARAPRSPHRRREGEGAVVPHTMVLPLAQTGLVASLSQDMSMPCRYMLCRQPAGDGVCPDGAGGASGWAGAEDGAVALGTDGRGVIDYEGTVTRVVVGLHGRLCATCRLCAELLACVSAWHTMLLACVCLGCCRARLHSRA